MLQNITVPNKAGLDDSAPIWDAVAKRKSDCTVTAGFWFGRPAPSRWCASWSRRPTKPRPRGLRPPSARLWSTPTLRLTALAPGPSAFGTMVLRSRSYTVSLGSTIDDRPEKPIQRQPLLSAR